MRLRVKPDTAVERLGLLANLTPVEAGLSMFAMPIARTMHAGQRLGVFRELVGGPASAAELARRLQLNQDGTKLLLDALCVNGVLRLVSGERYELESRSRKWLDPASDAYIGDFLADNHNYWQWWEGLEELVRDGRSVEMHDRPDDDPYWTSYIKGQYELARLSSPIVAKAVALDRGATSLLDIAGGHGEFSMALCRRHPELRATIVDLPGSARIGRGIVEEEGMAERIRFVEGDMLEADLGGPHDGALCFNIIHHLDPERVRRLFERVASALRPGAPLCVLDLYDRPPKRKPDSGSYLALFFHLTSGARIYTTDEVSEWMTQSGFAPPRRKRLIQIPGLALLRAERAA